MILESKALECGFDDVKTITTEQLPFDFSFRKFCEQNICGNYGANYACPPYCGTPEEMKKKAQSYKKAIVLRKSVCVDDYKDPAKIENAQAKVRELMMEAVKRFKNVGYEGCASMPGACRLCKECEAKSGGKCRSSQNVASCISAYCIDAKKLSGICKLEDACEKGKISFTCLYFFNG